MLACTNSLFKLLCLSGLKVQCNPFQDTKESFKICHGLMFCSSHSKPRLQVEEEQVALHFKTLK